MVMSVFNAMQTIAFYGFGSWVPTLLIAKGIHITTSLQYAFIIALANPVGPFLAYCRRRPDRAQMADRGGGRASPASASICSRAQDVAALVILFGVLVTMANNWLSFTLHGYQAEQFPTRIRARAVGFVYSWSRVSRGAGRA